MRLKDRVALVTGSSRGIGAAIARRLAADGAKVIIHSGSTPNEAEKVAEDIRSSGGSAAVVMGNLGERETPVRIVREAFAIHGVLDILVNNAAIANYRLIKDQTLETMEHELAVDLHAVIMTTSEFVRLTQSPHGRIINISSTAGLHSAYGRSVYSAAKGGMEAFTRSVAQEVGERGITANVVAPGGTATEALEKAEKDMKIDYRGIMAPWMAMRRIGQVEDIADIVAFVASDDARWLTGNTLAADGGSVTTGINVVTYSKSK
jgi:3-oxoacyl-[acyl-carrier protein] reductase